MRENGARRATRTLRKVQGEREETFKSAPRRRGACFRGGASAGASKGPLRAGPAAAAAHPTHGPGCGRKATLPRGDLGRTSWEPRCHPAERQRNPRPPLPLPHLRFPAGAPLSSPSKWSHSPPGAGLMLSTRLASSYKSFTTTLSGGPRSSHFANEASSWPWVAQQEVVKSDSSPHYCGSKNKQPGFMQTLWIGSEALVELHRESHFFGSGDHRI